MGREVSIQDLEARFRRGALLILGSTCKQPMRATVIGTELLASQNPMQCSWTLLQNPNTIVSCDATGDHPMHSVHPLLSFNDHHLLELVRAVPGFCMFPSGPTRVADAVLCCGALAADDADSGKSTSLPFPLDRMGAGPRVLAGGEVDDDLGRDGSSAGGCASWIVSWSGADDDGAAIFFGGRPTGLPVDILPLDNVPSGLTRGRPTGLPVVFLGGLGLTGASALGISTSSSRPLSTSSGALSRDAISPSQLHFADL